jgi:hypothetical protein
MDITAIAANARKNNAQDVAPADVMADPDSADADLAVVMDAAETATT